LIILTRKKDIYKGGEIGYDEEENQAHSEPLFFKNGEERLKVRVVGRSYLIFWWGRT
jgi:hypothetical protein